MRNIVLGACLAIALAPPLQARPLKVEDIDKMREVSSPAVDPSGKWVAYVVGTVDSKADKNFSHIWMTSWDGKQTLQLTNRK